MSGPGSVLATSMARHSDLVALGILDGEIFKCNAEMKNKPLKLMKLWKWGAPDDIEQVMSILNALPDCMYRAYWNIWISVSTADVYEDHF